MTITKRLATAAAAVVPLLLHARNASCFSPGPKQHASFHGFSNRVSTARPYGESEDGLAPSRFDQEDAPCLVGDNVVASCDVLGDAESPLAPSARSQGISAAGAGINLGKCICGAGSFALPHVFLEEGVLGGLLAMTACAVLATTTMQSINRSRILVAEINDGQKTTDVMISPPKSYVELANMALGEEAARLVFTLTVVASLGVCSTYIVFIGQTLASLSADASSNNIIHSLAPNINEMAWEALTALTVFPLSLVRNYSVFAFTSALGVTAVLGGILVTLAYGILVDPGGGIIDALLAVSHLKMWPESFSDAFGGSFGTIAYLFCVNFLTFPIINSMKDSRNDYDGAVATAVTVIWTVNVIFAIICLGFYGENTQDLVLQNLDNGPYLSALKILLCVDLLFTF